MWENETVVLVTSLKKRLLAGAKKVRYSKIQNDNAIPPYIKSIFLQKVEEYIKNETPFSIAPTEHFDIQPSDLVDFKSRITDVLRESASFPSNEIEEILRQSLVLRLDYLVKPADTMRRLLFDKRDYVQLSEMDISLDPYKKLLPYSELLIKECNRLGYDRIESDEYSKIIVDLFHQLMNGESIPVILRDFSVLTDFLSEAKGEQVTRVDGDVMQEFLADRNLWNYRRALDIELKLGKEDFDSVDLEMTMKRYVEMRAEFFESEAQDVKTRKPDIQKEEDEEILEAVLEAHPTKEETPVEEIIEEQEAGWDIEDDMVESSVEIEGLSDTESDEEVIEEVEKMAESEILIEPESEAEPDIEFEIEAPIEAELKTEHEPEPEPEAEQETKQP
ncbi:hypothetical protein HQ585_13140, partial [candidate division KSB1 bacterium]|nr:hypothetical protein [candidate division KSB1 bacterium]